MSNNYSYNSLGRQTSTQSQSQNSGSQQNLSGTLNRTQVERRGAQFISARGRVNSNDDYMDNDGYGSLRRTAKSQDRLNSTSSSIGGSRSNIGPQRGLDRSGKVGGGSRGNISQQSYGGGGGGGNAHNYSNLPPSPAVNDDYAVVNKENNYRYNTNQNQNPNQNPNQFGSRKALESQSSINSQNTEHSVNSGTSHANNFANSNNSSTNSSQRNSFSDSRFHEFEKIRVEHQRKAQLYEDTTFLPNDASLYYSRSPPYQFEWIRSKVRNVLGFVFIFL